MLEKVVHEALKNHLGCRKIERSSSVSGGCINRCFVFDTDKGKFFVKVHTTSDVTMFEAEAKGLLCLDNTVTLRVPMPYYYGSHEGNSFLILEYLEMVPHRAASQRQLGTLLAKMHQTRTPRSFGFEIHNTIGSTPQINHWMVDWCQFFQEYRLGYQLHLVEKRYEDSALVSKGEKLLEKMQEFFRGITIRPSLLHGDLWQGNTAADPEGNPIVFDPAPYYGHHEAELSIASMFGGFSSEFYEAYHELIPKEPGFAERQLLYQLYHYLNHYNIFGASYRPSCFSILEKLV